MPVPSKANVDLKELGGEVVGASSRLVWRWRGSRRFEGSSWRSFRGFPSLWEGLGEGRYESIPKKDPARAFSPRR